MRTCLCEITALGEKPMKIFQNITQISSAYTLLWHDYYAQNIITSLIEL